MFTKKIGADLLLMDSVSGKHFIWRQFERQFVSTSSRKHTLFYREARIFDRKYFVSKSSRKHTSNVHQEIRY